MARRGSRLNIPQSDPAEAPHACEAPGCPLPGEYRAPAAPDRLREFRWFCLEHVREYNRGWDYYKGMDASGIERHIREDVGWGRPTWPLGTLGSAPRFDPDLLRDPLGLLRGHPQTRRAPPREEAPAELRAALGLLALPWPLEFAVLRARYRELAKLHHPDANGGDRASEERLKDINQAYALLRRRLDPRRVAEAPAARAAAG